MPGTEDSFVANLAPIGSLQEEVNMHELLRAKDAEISMLRKKVEDRTLQLADASRLRDEAMDENDALRQEAADWRSAKYIAESKETARALELIDVMKERDALRQESRTLQAQLAMSESAEVVTAVKLESVTAERDALLKVREAADALVKELEDESISMFSLDCIKAYKEARDAG